MERWTNKNWIDGLICDILNIAKGMGIYHIILLDFLQIVIFEISEKSYF